MDFEFVAETHPEMIENLFAKFDLTLGGYYEWDGHGFNSIEFIPQ